MPPNDGHPSRDVLFVSPLCRAGMVVYLSARSRQVCAQTPRDPCTAGVFSWPFLLPHGRLDTREHPMTTAQRTPKATPAPISAARLQKRLGDPTLTIVDV